MGARPGSPRRDLELRLTRLTLTRPTAPSLSSSRQLLQSCECCAHHTQLQCVHRAAVRVPPSWQWVTVPSRWPHPWPHQRLRHRGDRVHGANLWVGFVLALHFSVCTALRSACVHSCRLLFFTLAKKFLPTLLKNSQVGSKKNQIIWHYYT